MAHPRNVPDGPSHLDPEHPLRETLIQRSSAQPLGVLLVCRHNKAWQDAPPEVRRRFNLEDSSTLKGWEDRIEGCIYRIYGLNGGEKCHWSYFSLLEFDDLEAWNQLQQRLDESGFSTYFEWDIIAFGRRIG